ncbi:MAG: ketopantoate reductase family protein [Methyloligellaceae bacterium]
MNKKIAILGTGANGSSAAADLTRAGFDVTLFDQWPDHVREMQENGLKIVMPDREIQTPVDAYHLCDICGLNKVFDIVLLFVKAYDTRWCTELITPYLAEDGLIVGVQNGMTTGDIADIVGKDRTLGCVVELSAEIFTPGLVQRNTPPERTWFGIGSLDESTNGREIEIEEILRHVGKVSITDDIVSAKWMKLVVNTMCLGPFAMLGMTLHEAVKIPEVRELNLRIGSEALAAGQRMGYKIEPIFGLQQEDIQDSNRLLEKLLDKLGSDIGPAARDCVLQDHLKGRYSEVDAINGLVVSETEKNGGQAPANAAIVEITQRIRSGEIDPSVENLGAVLKLVSEYS